MRILLWAKGGSSKTRYWGPGTNSYKLYSSNKDKNIEVTQVHGVKDLDVDKNVFKRGVFISNYDNPSLLDKILFMIKSKRWIKKNFKKYDVFHGLGAFEETFTNAYYFSKLGKPAFIHMTGSEAAFLNNSKFSKLLGLPQRRVKRANEITGYIANSKAMVEMLLKIGVKEEKIHNITNHTDVDLFKPVNEEEKKQLRKELKIPDRYTVVLIGGLCYRKRTFELTQACGNLLKKGLELNLVLVGPDREKGEMKKKITTYIKNNNLDGFIHVIDFTPLPNKYYQIGDLFVLASKHEGMPGSLIEAMSSRLPSIVTEISGSEDLITPDINGLYTNGTVEDIEEKIKFLFQNREIGKKFGKNARNLIVKKYSTKAVLQNHLDLFNKYIH